MHIDPNAHKSGKVTISYDPSVIRKPTKKKRNRLSKKEYMRETAELLQGNGAYDMGYRSTNSKLKRLEAFKKGFEQRKFVTVTAAQNYMQAYANNITYETCLAYAKELNLMIYDDRKNKWTKGAKPKYAQ